MSRNRAFDYVLPMPVQRPDEPWDLYDDAMDRLMEAADARLPGRNRGGGAGCRSAGEITYTIFANKTKARRMADRLDKHLGVIGTLREWDDD